MKFIKRISLIFLLSFNIFAIAGCRASDEKIIQAQSKYKDLVNLHNQVVEAHNAISDNSLYQELNVLTNKMEELKAYNLYEMNEEEVDVLMQVMDTLNETYSRYLKTIGEIKINEDAAVLTPITFALANNTGKVFSGLSLMEKGETDLVTDILKTSSGFEPGQMMTGLTIHRDVDETPWILSLIVLGEEDSEEEFSVVLDSNNLPSSGVTLSIKINDETGELYIE